MKRVSKESDSQFPLCAITTEMECLNLTNGGGYHHVCVVIKRVIEGFGYTPNGNYDDFENKDALFEYIGTISYVQQHEEIDEKQEGDVDQRSDAELGLFVVVKRAAAACHIGC